MIHPIYIVFSSIELQNKKKLNKITTSYFVTVLFNLIQTDRYTIDNIFLFVQSVHHDCHVQ